MQDASHEAQMREIMGQFELKTGLSRSAQCPERYLWTDASAVCNFFQLYRHTGKDTYRLQALDLVEMDKDQDGAFTKHEFMQASRQRLRSQRR